MIWLHELDPSADDQRSAAHKVGIAPGWPAIRALSHEGLNHKSVASHETRKQSRFL